MVQKSIEKLVSHVFAMPLSAAELLVCSGQVRINGKMISRTGGLINASRETLITVKEDTKPFCQFYHVLLHKPTDTLTSLRAEIASRQTVYDILAQSPLFRPDLRAVGRLDFTTTGLLLFTTDTELLQRMTHPDHHLSKCYECGLLRPCSPTDALSFKIGFRLASQRRPNEVDLTLPAVLETVDGSLTAKVTIYEGMHHQIKRMFRAVQNEVVSLKRLSMGPVTLEDSLLPGHARALTWDEHDALYKAVRLKPPK